MEQVASSELSGRNTYVVGDIHDLSDNRSKGPFLGVHIVTCYRSIGKYLSFRVYQHTDDGEASAVKQAWICRLPKEGQNACLMPEIHSNEKHCNFGNTNMKQSDLYNFQTGASWDDFRKLTFPYIHVNII